MTDTPNNEMIAALVEPFDSTVVSERTYASSDSSYFMISIPRAEWVAFAEAAKASGFDVFSDLFAIDHFTDAPRFEVVLNLVSMRPSERIVVSHRSGSLSQRGFPMTILWFPRSRMCSRVRTSTSVRRST